MASKKSKAFDAARHLQQGKENEQLARALLALDSCYKDWVITLIFYAALHYIYSKLPVSDIPHTHEEAKPLILQSCGGDVFKLYSDLSDKSRNARYYPAIAEAYRNSSLVSENAIKTLETLKEHLGIN